MTDCTAKGTRYFIYEDIAYCFFKIIGEQIHISWSNNQGSSWNPVDNPLIGTLTDVQEPKMNKKGYLEFRFESSNAWVAMERNMNNFEHKFLKAQSQGQLLNS
jgi:hypothetical protein